MNDRSRETERTAQQAEAGYVRLATWTVLAVLGLSLIIADISIFFGSLMIFPLPIVLLLRRRGAKKRVKMRQEQVREHHKNKRGD